MFDLETIKAMNQPGYKAKATEPIVSNPDAPKLHIFDVEMQGITGHTCTVTLLAEKIGQAEVAAAHRFPELTVTGNTRDLGAN